MQVYYIYFSCHFLKCTIAYTTLAFPEAGWSFFSPWGWMSALTKHIGVWFGCSDWGCLWCFPEPPMPGRLHPLAIFSTLCFPLLTRCLSVTTPSDNGHSPSGSLLWNFTKGSFECLNQGFSLQIDHSVLSNDCHRCVALLPPSETTVWEALAR